MPIVRPRSFFAVVTRCVASMTSEQHTARKAYLRAVRSDPSREEERALLDRFFMRREDAEAALAGMSEEARTLCRVSEAMPL